jgi:RTX calcium-binding nonapeptide repeat (4 copies)
MIKLKTKAKQIGDAANDLVNDANSSYLTNHKYFNVAPVDAPLLSALDISLQNLAVIAIDPANSESVTLTPEVMEEPSSDPIYPIPTDPVVNNNPFSTEMLTGTEVHNGYYRYSIIAVELDQSGQTLGEQFVSGQMLFYDESFNALPALNLYSVEFRSLPQDYASAYNTDNIFTDRWLTDYAQWTIKATTDTGVKVIFTTNMNGFSTHLVNLEYEVDNIGNPLGALPDIGTPWLVNPTIEDVEAYQSIVWTPTITINNAGLTQNSMVYNDDAGRNFVIVTKNNAIVNGGDDNDSILGSTHGDILNGDEGLDSINGYGGDDTLNGGEGNDGLFGGKGNDQVNGGNGDDSIYISTTYDDFMGTNTFNIIEGNDTLTGGAGADNFVFDFGNYTPNLGFTDAIATITDFQRGEDRILMLGLSLNADTIVQGTMPIAQDANDHILFNTQNSGLYFDADGFGTGKAVQIATLIGVNFLSANDFAESFV